ncbi:MAG: alanine racemase, partial [Elusimicrobia bacterium]|nr:alanine racemase [Elusimicrobiota bacterium]
THFSSAGSDPDFTRYQLKEFLDLTDYAKKLKLKFIAHTANSDAIFLHTESHLDMVRPGISLYGLWPYEVNSTNIKLDPVLSWKTKIVFLKKISEGTSISYGKTFTVKRPSVIATLPVGYADGYNRLLSNKGAVLVRGKRCPVLGRVTMDMIMVDVTGLEKAEIGDEAVLIGRQGEDQITAREIAELVGTINYEIVCSISYRVPRILV